MRAALAASAVAVAGGFVAAEYVGAGLFQYVSPAVLGALVASASQRAGLSDGTGVVGRRTRLIALAYAVLGVAFGVVRENPERGLTLQGGQLLASVIAAATAWAWSLPPRRHRPVQDVSGAPPG